MDYLDLVFHQLRFDESSYFHRVSHSVASDGIVDYNVTSFVILDLAKCCSLKQE